jgi:hypothetical protein
MNIKIVNAYRTISGEALSVLTEVTPIEIKVAETDRLHHITRDRQTHQRRTAEELDSSGRLRITEPSQEKDHTIHIYTVGSKNKHEVGSGPAIYMQNKVIQLKPKLHDRCRQNNGNSQGITGNRDNTNI